MAGHSHAANVMYRKAAVNNKRSKLWAKLARAITIAAKLGGGDPHANARLRKALLDARSLSMPKDNIERAIKKGTGAGGEMESVEEALYEGYGPGGVAILCEILTDNRNRTAGEVRKIFDLNDGKLGTSGCVSFLFDRKGLFVIPAAKTTEEKLMEVALEAGAEDVKSADEKFEVLCAPEDYLAVSESLAAAGIEPELSQVTRIPNTTVELDVEAARKVLKLMEQLDDHDDVQSVASNFKVSDEALAELAKG
jgi:YebC/PmpR family DNA-binding regulatory protein